MSSEEYRAAITRLGLSNSQAAQMLGVDPRSSRRWLNGTRDVSETAARFLRFLIAAEITPAEVARALLADAGD